MPGKALVALWANTPKIYTSESNVGSLADLDKLGELCPQVVTGQVNAMIERFTLVSPVTA